MNVFHALESGCNLCMSCAQSNGGPYASCINDTSPIISLMRVKNMSSICSENTKIHILCSSQTSSRYQKPKMKKRRTNMYEHRCDEGGNSTPNVSCFPAKQNIIGEVEILFHLFENHKIHTLRLPKHQIDIRNKIIKII